MVHSVLVKDKLLHAVTCQIAGETIAFYSGKAAFWQREATLIVADLHWGKAGVLRAAGIPISEDVLIEDLRRLEVLIRTTEARRVIVLGDLIHAASGLTPACVDLVAAWRRPLAVELSAVIGNHDRHIRKIPSVWNLEILGEVAYEGPFCFRHEPIVSATHHVWAGHVHPMYVIHGGGDKLRLPCFWLRDTMTILPSFSLLTRGSNIRLSRSESALVVHEDGIVPWTATPRRRALAARSLARSRASKRILEG